LCPPAALGERDGRDEQKSDDGEGAYHRTLHGASDRRG
jgi:hypothetical protein